MQKLDGKSKDLVNENIEKLKEIFPEVFSEGKIDFSKLEEELGNFKEKSDERYNFTWNGKSEAKKIALTPSTGTLRPCKEESKDWDTTQNLYIEGDNLEVLKLLQKSYHKKVKMIYIDPPYNTGKDFVYKDNFRDNIKNYLEITGQVDSDGNKLSTNSETSGRYHSDWLNMMYPRLKLARNLLKDDGVIFISIDDNEVANLRKLCDEIFGEDNFVATFIWEKTFRPSNFGITTRRNTEYVLCYSKSTVELKGILEDTKGDFSLTKKEHIAHILNCPANYVHAKFEDGIYKKGVYSDGYELIDDIKVISGKIVNEFRIKISMSIWSQSHLNKEIEKGVYLVIKNKSTMAIYARKIYQQSELKPTTLIPNSIVGDVLEANKEINDIYKQNIFEYPKPTSLIQFLMNTIANQNDLILDFFSGSATTAHAVMKLNSEDDGNRKFICVQLPETTDEKSEAYKAGYKNICEIGKERIRRAGEKVKSESGKTELDIGFKVLKLDSSNIKSWDSDFENLETNLLDAVENIKSDRNEEDLVYEILLKYGLDLALPIEELNINGKKIFSIGFGSLVCCLDNDIDTNIVEKIAELKKQFETDFGLENMRVVFKDSSFKDSVVKTNALQILKQNGINEVVSI
ncbi:site-specific DNA-methyltransferase [Arcobacter cryaerophilus gv. pseudocryaerophilus]|uniref:site-specific DNA-methyltransferase (adenine-specific) n=3 Tax=Arcobacteraceae TaxID=2808963 RepID=A0AA96IIP9_9BACT|nr:site-specific DNA-methyltransferase [Arcobacter sp. AZ-2023]WNL36725.1 site-specific DNA-methyltransferase [Arcobacter sp. AZ-2023]WPD12441.1 site-specific DNA-methyltransferase [Arcobacter sp. DSM 115960]